MSNVAIQVCVFKYMSAYLLPIADIAFLLNYPSFGGVINKIIEYTLIVKTPLWDGIVSAGYIKCLRLSNNLLSLCYCQV